MTTQFSKLFLAATVAALTTSAAMADGYSAAGTGTVTATAKVTINVNVPKLILLRVGADNATVDTLTFAPTVSIPGAPTTPADGNNVNAPWTGAAPIFTAPTAQTLTAFAWTNSSGGGQLGLASVETAGATSLTAANILVTPTVVTGALPAHPASTTTNANFGTFTRNTVHSSTWAYTVDGTALTASTPGAYTQTTTYTATSL